MPRILFLDAYDSFSNNIVNLLRDQLTVTVEVIKTDDPRFVFNDDGFHEFLHGFDAVVCGPGPGHPANPKDVGLIGKLWNLPDEHLLPVLGICLGFQSLSLAFGARVEKLREPRHGMVTPVTHCGRDIFEATGEVIATQYHSLHVVLDDRADLMDDTTDLWTPSPKCVDLLPLAWDLSDDRNGPILSGVRHSDKPFWGVQYHPESICTDSNGQKMVELWWQRASVWNSSHLTNSCSPSIASLDSTPVTPLDLNGCIPNEKSLPRQIHSTPIPGTNSGHNRVHWKPIELCEGVNMVDIMNALRSTETHEPILLESGVRNGRPLNSETGRFSIVGLHDKHSTQIRFSTSDHQLISKSGDQTTMLEASTTSAVLDKLKSFVEDGKAHSGPTSVPFWGGLIGFISYEAGLETIDVPPVSSQQARPDVYFVWVDRSIVVDHITNVAYVQTLHSDDQSWSSSTEQKLTDLRASGVVSRSKADNAPGQVLAEPTEDEYCQKVELCQSHLRAGSSYELCLTDQTLMENKTKPWELYQTLRQANPAPFGAYLDLKDQDQAGISIVGSSPERFLSWSREGTCQFRPIKGTVKKGPDMTRAKADEILASAKERAENLMIVDLIRHDLNGVPGVHGVRVPKLMVVEEYETVYQLVSVIEGDVVGPGNAIAALSRSLPPGSMTGAPKKRSCELLKDIEGQQARGLYSGVLGYLDVGGGGDFSVVIRTAFKWADEDAWRIGAGGAVTALSEPEAEWEEMLTKRERLLDVFT